MGSLQTSPLGFSGRAVLLGTAGVQHPLLDESAAQQLRLRPSSARRVCPGKSTTAQAPEAEAMSQTLPKRCCSEPSRDPGFKMDLHPLLLPRVLMR